MFLICLDGDNLSRKTKLLMVWGVNLAKKKVTLPFGVDQWFEFGTSMLEVSSSEPKGFRSHRTRPLLCGLRVIAFLLSSCRIKIVLFKPSIELLETLLALITCFINLVVVWFLFLKDREQNSSSEHHFIHFSIWTSFFSMLFSPFRGCYHTITWGRHSTCEKQTMYGIILESEEKSI